VKVKEAAGKKPSLPLHGKTFVFTGKLENHTPDEGQRRVEELGGRATSSVSGDMDYVVAGEDPGGKLDKAKKQKVRVLDEKEFLRLIAGG
jgi:DNA ligase (NAD+)